MLIIITPILGSLKNFIKYKKFNIFILLRTPIIYFFIQLLVQTNNIYKILIYERWFMFLFKISRSAIRNDFIINKKKYEIKYNIDYDQHTL
tara:strand:+ start:1669 stop:1941 length:273 start_codon:yes stop_codon:yes gene_type:complete